MIKLSIITINLNNAEGLRKTIESVINQTYNDFEYIIIDGASTDGSVEVIKEYADRVSYWVSEPDKGIYNAMNKGIKVANGEYVQFLNSGDWFVDNNTLDNVFSVYRNSDIIYGNVIYTNKDKTWKSIFPSKLSLSLFYNKSNICHQGVFTKRNFLLEIGLYDESYKISADYDSYIKAIMRNKSFEHIDQFIVKYNREGISSTQIELMNKEFQMSLDKNIPNEIQLDYVELVRKRIEIDNFHKSNYYKLYNKTKLYRNAISLFLYIMAYLDYLLTKIWRIIKKFKL